MADSKTSSKVPQATQQWPSPWPYDFPATHSADKVDRLKPKDATPPLKTSRRGLFSAATVGWMSFAAAGGMGKLALVRFLFPNVSFEPAQVFSTDKPKTAFNAEAVDESWKESDAVWIANTGGKLMAISTVCTHLGCTPNWASGEKKYKCPCHGSGYYIDGVNFEGPTPRPLERFRIYEDPVTGNVIVDKTVKCQVELGTCEASQFYIDVA